MAAALIASGAQAQAQGGRDYCPERPGLDTPACVVDRGRVSVETSLLDWTREKDRESSTDTLLVADTLVRIGVSETVEARLGWTPFGHVRERDRASGEVERASRVGDVTLGLKANLAHPDGEGAAVALLPYVSLPIGRSPVGASDWGAGLLAPMSFDLGHNLRLDATPEVDAAVDEDGRGRHLAYGGAAGVEWSVSDAVTLVGEAQLIRDRDPADRHDEALGSVALAWMLRPGLQLDAQAIAGLNRDSPDLQLVGGMAVLF